VSDIIWKSGQGKRRSAVIAYWIEGDRVRIVDYEAILRVRPMTTMDERGTSEAYRHSTFLIS